MAKVKMIEGVHLTAANKRTIRAIVEHGAFGEFMKLKRSPLSYKVTETEKTGIYEVIVRKEQRNDRGEKAPRQGRYIVEYK